MADAPLVGNRVVLLPDFGQHADGFGAKLRCDVLAQYRGRRKQAQAGATEGGQQCAVLEFADDQRRHILAFQPAFDLPAQGVAARRQQHRGAAEISREAPAIAFGQRWRAEQRDFEFTEGMAEHLQVAAVRRRAIGQHHVEAMQGEFGEEGVELAFAADQAHLLRQVEHRFHQAKSDQLGQCVGNADCQSQRILRVCLAQRCIHVLAELEDLVGVGQCQAPGLGRHQTSPLRRQQRLAQGLLEQGDLRADGLHRHAKPPRRACYAALAGDDPEVAQVVVIQCRGLHVSYFTNYQSHFMRFIGSLNFRRMTASMLPHQDERHRRLSLITVPS